MFKKIASLVLMICVLSISFPIMHYEVQASDYTYDVTKALEYAKKNWNSKTMKCAEFVTRAVKAGGLDIAIKTGTGSAYREIGNAIGINLGTNKNPDVENNKDLPNISTLTLNSSGYPTKADNEDILKAGDVVIQWCFSDHIAPHILICSGYNDKGIATFYATNNGLNNGTYNFNKNSQHKGTCKIGAKVIQFNTLKSESEAVANVKWSDMYTEWGKSGSSDILRFYYSYNAIGNITDLGVTVWDNEGQTYTLSSNKNSTEYLQSSSSSTHHLWFSYYGFSFETGKDYYWKVHLVVDGVRYESPIESFVF